MKRFMTGISELVEDECYMEILVDDMDISQLMVFSQQIEESKLRKERDKKKKRYMFERKKSFNAMSEG